MSIDTHSFNVELAKFVGLGEAIILQHLYWWYQHNSQSPEMSRDGRVWVYRSVKEMRTVFPYLSDGNIRTAIKHLIEKGLIIRGDYSEQSMNKSIWYSLTDSAIRLFHLSESANPFVESQNGFVGFNECKDNSIDNKKDSRESFIAPTLEQVSNYCLERRNGVDAQRFLDYYTANGWMVGKSRMKDWKAAVRTWEGRKSYTPQQPKLSPEERTIRALENLQNRDGQLNNLYDEQ